MNKNIESRLKRIENSIKITKAPAVVEIVHFADTLLPDRTENGVTTKFVRYIDLKREYKVA
jgi:hypothetical protein